MALVNQQWQPIDTAPKVGAHLAWEDGKRPYVIVWLNADHPEASEAGWHEHWCFDPVSPTHWMPLPKAPDAAQQQHTQEPVAEVCATSYIANDGDVHTKIEIKRLQNVKVGTLLYAFPPDAAARIAELDRTLRQQAEAVTATINRHHQQMAELEKQRDTLLAALNREAQSQHEAGYEINPWITDAIASVKEQA